MRAFLIAACAVLLTCAGALAQTASPAPATGAGRPSAETQRPYRSIAARFTDANATHDGHLTLEQAKAGMPAIARHFDEIDTAHVGFLTLDQVRTYAVAWRRAHPDGVDAKP